MKGTIYIDGNLYFTETKDGNNDFKKSGIVIQVEGELMCISDLDGLELEEDDVLIEGLFNKMDIKDILVVKK